MTTADAGGLLDPAFGSLLRSPPFARLDFDVLKQLRLPPPELGPTDLVDRVDFSIGDPARVPVRVHRPHDVEGPLPAVLSIHGGGFIFGSYIMDDGLFEEWCPQLGIVGVSVDYRLAPEAPFPGPLDDCQEALRWIHEHADGLGIDSKRVGVYGVSAGGGLAAALAQKSRDEGTDQLAFVLLEAPMLDDRLVTPSSRMEGLAVWSRESNEFGWRCYLDGHFGATDLPAYAAPARTEDLAGLPATFISVGGVDGFRDEDIDYAVRLSQAGVPTELHVYPGAPHGYQLFGDSSAARQGRRDRREWLARQLVNGSDQSGNR